MKESLESYYSPAAIRQRRRRYLYNTLLIVWMGGMLWMCVFFGIVRPPFPVCCPFRLLTGVPCPACGTTCSVAALLDGQFLLALEYNPFGYVLLPCAIILPLWIVRDRLCRSDSFYRFFCRLERVAERPVVILLVGLLVLLIWMWNIHKC